MKGIRLKTIEIVGFKSFPERTIIEIPDGITAIIGPNGCGKSNIFDAIKWCIGEHSLKSLRIKSSDEVLFAGNDKRKEANMCEVALTLEGETVKKLERVPEVRIERRFYRGGESEYFINGRNVKLKDIHDFFLEIGFSSHGIAIVEQGEITTIATAKPEDLRLYLDEASGVMKYKLRYREALKKLEWTKMELQRVDDVLSEVKRQINLVQKYAKKAEKAKKLKERIRELELIVYGHEFREKSKSLMAINSALSEINENLTRIKTETADLERDLENISSSLKDEESFIIEKEEELKTAKERESELQKEISSLYSSMRIKEEKFQSLCNSLKEIVERIEVLRGRKEDLEKEKKEMEMLLRKADEERKEVRERIEALRSKMEILSQESSSHRNLVFELSSSALKIKGEIIDKRRDRELRLRELDKRIKERKSILESLSILEEVQESLKKEREEVESGLSISRARREEMGTELTALSQRIKDLEEALSKLKEEKEESVTKYEAIEKLKKEHGFHEDGVKFLLKNMNENGFRGTLVEFIEVESGYEKAFESALRGYADAIIVEDIGIAVKGIKELKDKEAGEAGFLILNGRIKSERAEITHPEIIGRISEFIKAKNEEGERIREIMNDVFIVKDASAFERLPSEFVKEGKFVTLDGDVFEKGFLLRGGKGKGGIFSKERELRELSEKVEKLSVQIFSIHNELSELIQKKQTLEKEISKIEEKIREYEKRAFEVQHNFSYNQKEMERLRAGLNVVEDEIKRFNEEIDKLTEEEKSLNMKLEELERTNAELRLRREDLEIKSKEVENELKEETSKLAEREGFFSRVQAEFQNLLKEIHKAEEELVYLKKKGLEIYAIASKICWERWEEERRLQTLKEELNDVKERVKEIYREIEICKKEISALLERREEMHKRISEKREEMEKNMNERASISEQKVQIETAISYIKEDIYRKYAVDIENVEVPEVIDESLKAELKEKLEELEKLGEVSMHALDEYEELSSRHSFLSSQKEDLLKAMSDIEKLIKRIREETKDMFKESFESVQEKFNELISTFMEGGKGEIKMVNPDDLFDSGIELFVQPSGKKLKHMGLLSGGEKALVALAFIFSVLSIKDVPFAFFDEIDAPLDDINIQRFVWLLRKMAENSQVIIITHNKLTMSYATALYGVSMEEPGVSKILSVQLKR